MAQAERKPLIPQGAAFFQLAEGTAPLRRFHFLLCPSFTLLAFSAAIDPLRIANQLSQRALYDWRILSVDGGPVVSSSGVSVNVDASLAENGREDVLLICAGNDPAAPEEASTEDAAPPPEAQGGVVPPPAGAGYAP